jgi:hypothetical protein
MADIGQAIAWLREGKSIQRHGWNGKGMHVYMEDAHTEAYPQPKGNGERYQVAAYLVLFNAQGVRQPGWNASTPDLLAQDWEVAEHD